MLNNPLKTLTKKEWLLWLVSLTVVILSNLATNDLDLLTLISALLGVTALIFAAKGNVWAQFLMIIFCILYGIISFRFHYWGEMITYLGMTLPMAAWSAIRLFCHERATGDQVHDKKGNRSHNEDTEDTHCDTLDDVLCHRLMPLQSYQ